MEPQMCSRPSAVVDCVTIQFPWASGGETLHDYLVLLRSRYVLRVSIQPFRKSSLFIGFPYISYIKFLWSVLVIICAVCMSSNVGWVVLVHLPCTSNYIIPALSLSGHSKKLILLVQLLDEQWLIECLFPPSAYYCSYFTGSDPRLLMRCFRWDANTCTMRIVAQILSWNSFSKTLLLLLVGRSLIRPTMLWHIRSL